MITNGCRYEVDPFYSIVDNNIIIAEFCWAFTMC